MADFKEWIDEMITRVKIIEKECIANQVNARAELLIERGVEPYGLWNGGKMSAAQPPIPEDAKANALEAAKKKYSLSESNGSLVLQKNLAKPTFKECANLLNELGYIYDQSVQGFKKGVKQ